MALTPEQALGFVRSRGYDDDFGRIARQQRFIKEVIDEVARVGTLANPRRVVSLVDQGAKAVKTDDQLALGEMRDMALGLRSLTSSDVVAHTVPATPQTIGGVACVLTDEGPAETLFQSFRDGSVLRPAAEPDADPADPAADADPADPAADADPADPAADAVPDDEAPAGAEADTDPDDASQEPAAGQQRSYRGTERTRDRC